MRDMDASHSAEHPVKVPTGQVNIEGILAIPPDATGVVVFAHGSGSGRFSPRNNFVARVLQEGGIDTLLIDLLTEDEASDRRLVFDIDLLARRLCDIADWLQKNPDTRDLHVGYFGASTGAGAALSAAVQCDGRVVAIVSRGGRPDLALPILGQVQAPTLLIVGGDDEPVVSMNRQAYQALRCTKKLVIVPGATHLFEEPGALEEVARLARDWFQQYLGKRGEQEA